MTGKADPAFGSSGAVDPVVIDTSTDQVRSYSTAAGEPFRPILDTDAFATCP